MALGEVVSIEQLQALRERDQTIFRARLAGKSVRTIAETMSLDTASVEGSLRRMITALHPGYRRDLVTVEVERLDAVMAPFFEAACQGDARSALVFLKISERRSALLGLDAPTGVRTTAVTDAESKAESGAPTPADKMLRRLQEIAGSAVVVDGEGEEAAVEAVAADAVRSGPGDGGPSRAVGRDPGVRQGWDTGEEPSGRPGPFSGASAGQPRTERGEGQNGAGREAGKRAVEGDPQRRRGWDSGREPDGPPEGSAATRRMRMAGEVIDPDREGPEPRGSMTIFPPGAEDETMMQNGWEPPTEKLGADRAATVSMAEPWRPGRNRAET